MIRVRVFAVLACNVIITVTDIIHSTISMVFFCHAIQLMLMLVFLFFSLLPILALAFALVFAFALVLRILDLVHDNDTVLWYVGMRYDCLIV